MDRDNKIPINILSFGKYKGQSIIAIIATHIGYIMWCLDNIRHFKLNDIEQELYDNIAIAIKKYHIDMSFPIDTLLKYVKDTDSLNSLSTKIEINNCGIITPLPSAYKDPLLSLAINEIKEETKHNKNSILNKINIISTDNFYHKLSDLVHCMESDIDNAELYNEQEDNIYGGWNDFTNYKH